LQSLCPHNYILPMLPLLLFDSFPSSIVAGGRSVDYLCDFGIVLLLVLLPLLPILLLMIVKNEKNKVDADVIC